MLDRLARAIVHHPRRTVAVWAAILLASLGLALFGVAGESLFARLETGSPRIPGADSDIAREWLEESEGGRRITALLGGVDLAAEGAPEAVGAALAPVRQDLAALDGVASVVDPLLVPGGLSNPAAAGLVSKDADGFLLDVELDRGLSPERAEEAEHAVVERLRDLPTDLSGIAPGATVLISSDTLITEAITGQLEQDLRTGETIALPFSLFVMVVVFGGFLAAGVPMAGAIASIAGGMLALLGITYLVDVDSSVVNVVTVLGLGLSIDYGLLIVSRFREELRAGMDDLPHTRARRRHRDPVVDHALHATLGSAGRTVAFSALTVAIAISGLLLMRPDILRSIGAGAVAVVVVALATALTLVPALLVLLGRRLLRPPLLSRIPGVRKVIRRLGDVAPERGVFSALAGRVQRHPWLVLFGTLGVLGLLAAPVLNLQMRNSFLELLPRESDQRAFVQTVAEAYPAAAAPEVTVVAEASLAQVSAWSAEVAALEDVAAVDPPVQSGAYVLLGVRTVGEDGGGSVATAVVREVRELDPGFEFHVTGQAAHQADFVAALADGLPPAAAVVALATLVLLFLMTGSVLVPVKALLINVLSLASSLGVTVWIFQDGHLEGLLGFTSPGGLETYLVAVVVAFAFGLAMDYEVFLLSRIKELYDRGASNDESVRLGLQRSGRIITSAALIIVLVFSGFVAGESLIIKEVGVALAVAVLLDATLVRMLLVPATMTLLGDRNWWAPKPLRRLHARFAIRH